MNFCGLGIGNEGRDGVGGTEGREPPSHGAGAGAGH